MVDQTMVSAAAKLLQIPEEKLSSLLKERNTLDSGEKWVTLKEAAEYAKVTTFTVRRWCTARRIVWRKLNRARCGRVIIDLRSLQQFIRTGCAG